MASPETLELFVHATLKAWRADPIEFLTNDPEIPHLFIKTVRTRETLELYDCQVNVVRAYMADEREKLIILKARQMGFSTIFALLALHRALFLPDQVINLFADKEDDAVRLLDKAIYTYKNLPAWAREVLPKQTVDNQLNAAFDNGSKIQCFTATKKSGRGETANLVLLDEWAFLGDGTGNWAETAWSAVEPTVERGGKFVGLSTANGLENFYHTMWQAAQDGDGWRAIFYPYSSIPGREGDWWEKQQRQFARAGQEWIVYQEYPRDAAEAFIKSGRTVFDIDRLRGLEPEMRPAQFRGDLGDQLYLNEDREGPLQIWVMPNDQCDYAIGADVAEGLEHGDFSDATVRLGVDQRSPDGFVAHPRGTVVARYRGHLDADLFGDALHRIGRFYKTALLGVEANNHGLSTIHRLQALNYPRMYRTRTQQRIYNQDTERYGWYTNKQTKPLMIDELVEAVRDGLIVFWDETLRRELMSFIRQPNGKLGKEGIRDDAVISTAISEVMLNHIFDVEYAPITETPYMSFKWWMNTLTPEKATPWI